MMMTWAGSVFMLDPAPSQQDERAWRHPATPIGARPAYLKIFGPDDENHHPERGAAAQVTGGPVSPTCLEQYGGTAVRLSDPGDGIIAWPVIEGISTTCSESLFQRW